VYYRLRGGIAIDLLNININIEKLVGIAFAMFIFNKKITYEK
jgi:hypothetical protein